MLVEQIDVYLAVGFNIIVSFVLLVTLEKGDLLVTLGKPCRADTVLVASLF